MRSPPFPSCLVCALVVIFAAEKSSDAPGEEWLTNNEGNNQQNKLASLGEKKKAA